MRIEFSTPISTDELGDEILFSSPNTGEIRAVCLCSSECMQDDVFFNLSKHPEYTDEALAHGAVYGGGISEYGKLAAFYRQKINPTVIAVTGSVGKTTQKEMLKATLSPYFRVHASSGNHNNEIGVPESILTMPPDTDILILEFGSGNPGDIEYLTSLSRPDIGVITAIGTSHLEKFGTRENIAKEKLSITLGMPHGAPLFLNGDEPLLRNILTEATTVYVGIETPECDVTATDLHLYSDRCEYTADGMKMTVPATGRHMIRSSLIAYAIGKKLGLSHDEILRAQSEYRPVGMRQNIYDYHGFYIFEDCYNASYESFLSAFETLDLYAAEKHARKIAVIGDILEVGERSEEIHRGIGKLCAKHNIDYLFAYGDMSEYAAIEAERYGLPESNVRFFAGMNHDETAEAAARVINDGDIVLFKASRSMQCEKIIGKIKKLK